MAILGELEGGARRRGSSIGARTPREGAHSDIADQFRRETTVRRAQRHSRMVRTLRWALPASAALIAGYFALTMIDASRIGANIVRSALPKIVPQNLTMQNPRYRGYTKDGGEYVVEAKTAQQDPKAATRIKLEHVNGKLRQPGGIETTLSSKSGLYDTNSEQITLWGNIRIASSSGGWARMTAVVINPKTGLIASTHPVSFGNPSGTVRAKQMKILQKSKEISLTGEVVATLKPATGKQPSDGAATQKANEAESDGGRQSAVFRMFSGGKGPVEITSDRLDIDDVKKTATFIGKVRAKQGEAVLSTPELRIAYSGAPSGGLTGAAPGTSANGGQGEASRVTSVVAAAPVEITQAPATRVTGQTAAFDAATQRATLEGGVVITRAPDTRITGQTAGFDDLNDVATIDGNVILIQGTDRRATGTHAEFNSREETALMTGDVVLTQGQNVLKGRRLSIDQKAGRSELSSPAGNGVAAGRISARFMQSNGKPAARRAATENENAGGLLAISSFKTDPGAPVDVTAQTLEVLEHKKLVVFRGDVEAQQGDFKVRTGEMNATYAGAAGIGQMAGAQAPRATDADAAQAARQPAAKLTRLQARGKVVVTSRNGQSATGDWADFDVAANTVTLGGDVLLSQGRNTVRGTRLVIDMTTGESVINTDNSAAPQVAGEKPGSGWRAYQKPSRPSAVFFPQQLTGQATSARAKQPQARGTGGGGWTANTNQTSTPRTGN